MAEKQSKMKEAADAKIQATRKPPRQMAAKACERCRRRKIKCDEFFPCGQCTRMRVQCKIEDPAEKRREQQQSAMEDRIKRLEALLIATYSNPNNHLDMTMPGLDTEGIIPGLGGGLGHPKPDPPRLTLQTPGSSEFRPSDLTEQQMLSAGDQSLGFSYWSPPSSIALSAPTSASDYYPSEVIPWSQTATHGSTPMAHSPRPNRTRTSSMSTSETSQDDSRSPINPGNNRLSVDTSGSTLGIPQIAVTSWDQSRPQSPAGGLSPALSPQSAMDTEMPWSYPPELSVGSWSGLSSPSIMAPAYPYEDHLSVTNQSLPSHSRRSSINSLNPDYGDVYNEPKRRRAASDLFPVPNQFVYPDPQPTEYFASQGVPRPNTPNLHPSASSSPIVRSQRLRQDSIPGGLPQLKDDIYTHTFHSTIHPLFPLLSPSNTQHTSLSPQIAQTQTYLLRAISTFILSSQHQSAMSTSSSQQIPFTPQQSHQHFLHALRLHGPGKWDSLPGIQSGVLIAIYILLTTPSPPQTQSSASSYTATPTFPCPNVYLLNATIVAAVLDLGLHRCRSPLQEGALEADTLLSAYVLDRTVSCVKRKPALLKDVDLSPEVANFITRTLASKLERGEVQRGADSGRLWDWWTEYEVGVRSVLVGTGSGMDVGMSDGLIAEHHGFGFGGV